MKRNFAVLIAGMLVGWGVQQGAIAKAVDQAAVQETINAKKAANQARIEEAKKKSAAAQAEHKNKAAQRQAEIEKRKAELEKRKAGWELKKAGLAAHGGEAVDARQGWQAKRIDHGIAKGYLTQNEINTLNAQKQSIASLETSLKSDGALSGSDLKQLQTALNTASHCIWAEKHDTDGNQMAAYAFGKNVFAQDEVTSKLANPDLPKSEARLILKDFGRMLELEGILASKDLADTDRKACQDEYNDLLNTYFVVK